MTEASTIQSSGQDVLIAWNPTLGCGDWSVTDGQLATTQTGADQLQNAVLISLFTDRVAPEDMTVPDRRGWWADSYRTRPIGSLLWTLNREKIIDANTILQRARGYCIDALQWLIDDDVASAVDVRARWMDRATMAIQVTITRNGNDASQTYGWLWRGF